MNRRIAAIVSASAVGAIMLTGCGSVGKSSVRGLVVEREQKVNKSGGTDYFLEVATDSKTNRKGKVTSKTKRTEVKVTASQYKACSLREKFPNCK
jgi:homoserine dehydrogenase